jgi:membrane protease YdiL (CAAX protease family)
MEDIFQTRPAVAIGSNVLWFSLVFLFLYVTLAVIHERPFWATVGWKRLKSASSTPSSPWVYFFGGIGLSICVNFATYFVKPKEHLPIEDLFKSRSGAFLLMGMAVLIAPLIEETVFRGYLYPLFASSFSRLAMKFGGDPASALRTGTALGIALTGALFGLLHGAQLGWTWGLVAMLVTVGIVFTFARARAGTVLASFLLHLGYNSMIAFAAIYATHGFTRMPPHP